MEYTIRLSQMEFRAYHGCYALEQRVGNRFAVDLQITTELGEIVRTDEVDRGVNYLTIFEITKEQMGITCNTIERVAVNIITAIKRAYPEIVRVRCEVAKLAPPLGGKISRVSVVVEQ